MVTLKESILAAPHASHVVTSGELSSVQTKQTQHEDDEEEEEDCEHGVWLKSEAVRCGVAGDEGLAAVWAVDVVWAVWTAVGVAGGLETEPLEVEDGDWPESEEMRL